MQDVLRSKIDTSLIKQNNRLADTVRRDLGEATVKSVKYSQWLCPFHPDGRKPGFTVWTESDRFQCFGCGEEGDVIAYVMKRENLTFFEACRKLGYEDKSGASRGVPDSQPGKIAVDSLRQRLLPEKPSDEWQERAASIMVDCETALWENKNVKVQEYLRSQRGLDRDILENYFIGYNPTAREMYGLYVPAGIIIPAYHVNNQVTHTSMDTLYGLKVRQPTGVEPKYKHVKGSKPAPFGVDSIRGKRVVIVTEGEFDCMLIVQALETINAVCSGAVRHVGAFTFGAATNLDIKRWSSYLLSVESFLVAVDTDTAGRKAAEHWQEYTNRAKRREPGGYKDLTDLWNATGDEGLMKWIHDALDYAHHEKSEPLIRSRDDIFEELRVYIMNSSLR